MLGIINILYGIRKQVCFFAVSTVYFFSCIVYLDVSAGVRQKQEVVLLKYVDIINPKHLRGD